MLAVALPAAGLSAAVTYVTSLAPSPGAYAHSVLPRDSAGLVRLVSWGPIEQDLLGQDPRRLDSDEIAGRAVSLDEVEGTLARLLPTGLELSREHNLSVQLVVGKRVTPDLQGIEGDLTVLLPSVDTSAVAADAARAGGVVLTAATADRLDAQVGDDVRVTAGGESVDTSVVGLTPGSVQGADVYLSPGTLIGSVDAAFSETPRSFAWHAVGAVPLPWSSVEALNAAGFSALSRAVAEDPRGATPVPSLVDHEAQSAQKVTLVLGAGMAGVLLAAIVGPILAIGHHRSRRTFALLSANGAGPRALRRAALAMAVPAAVLGSSLGVIAGAGAVALAHRIELLPGLVSVAVPLGALGLVWLTSVALAVGAGLVPARSVARAHASGALRESRAETSLVPPRTRPWRFIPLAGAIAVCAFGAASGLVYVALAGAVLAVPAAFLVTGALLQVVHHGSAGFRLPARFASRELVRHGRRSRFTIAATLGLMAVVSLGAVVAQSSADSVRAEYQEEYPLGTTALWLEHDDDEVRAIDATFDTLAGAMRAAFPGTAVEIDHRLGFVTVDDRHAPGTSLFIQTDDYTPVPVIGEIRPVSSEADLEALRGIDDRQAAREALAAGHVVLGSRALPEGAPVALRSTAALRFEGVDSEAEPSAGGGTEWPVVHLAGSVTLVPESFVDAIPGAASIPWAVLLRSDDPPSLGDEDEIRGITATALDNGATVSVYVERGPAQDSVVATVRIAVIAAALVATLLAWIITALAAAESRPDLATLFAVGSSPRTLRGIASTAGAVTGGTGALLGAALGTGLGVLVALAYVRADTSGTTTVGLPTLALALVILVPVVSALAALPVVRGAEGLALRREH